MLRRLDALNALFSAQGKKNTATVLSRWQYEVTKYQVNVQGNKKN